MSFIEVKALPKADSSSLTDLSFFLGYMFGNPVCIITVNNKVVRGKGIGT